MNKRANIALIIFGLIAVIAIIGLVLLFTGKLTGAAAGQPMTRQVLPNPEPFRIERPGGYACGCDGICAYTSKVVRASTTVDPKIADAEAACFAMLKSICEGQPILRFNFGCGTN